MTTIKGRAAAYDELTTALAEPLQELVDISHALDTTGADTYELVAELRAGVAALVAAVLDTDAADDLIPDTAVRHTETTYREMAQAVAES